MAEPNQAAWLQDPWTLEEIRALEHKGLQAGLPLMQRAADCALAFILDNDLCAHHALILAGPGNNGGDAITLALGLLDKGRKVTLILPKAPATQAADARAAFARWQRAGGRALADWPKALTAVDLVIDGLFGIGLNRALHAPWATLVTEVNECPYPVLSLDIPSGLDAQSGLPLGNAVVRANWTIAFIAPSTGLCLPRARPFIGEPHVCTLGLRKLT